MAAAFVPAACVRCCDGALEQLDGHSPLKLMAAMTAMFDKPMHDNKAVCKPS
jgi:hypothetical protein